MNASAPLKRMVEEHQRWRMIGRDRKWLIGPDRKLAGSEFVPVPGFANDMIVTGLVDILGDVLIHCCGVPEVKNDK
jgi:hypothetical protein